jgi:hypothetical protein
LISSRSLTYALHTGGSTPGPGAGTRGWRSAPVRFCRSAFRRRSISLGIAA